MNRIDKIFKQKLEHASLDVPEYNWDKISAKLEQQEKTKRAIWPYALAIFILVGGLISLLWIMNDKSFDVTRMRNNQMVHKSVNETISKNLVNANQSQLKTSTSRLISDNYKNSKYQTTLIDHNLDAIDTNSNKLNIEKNIYKKRLIVKELSLDTRTFSIDPNQSTNAEGQLKDNLAKQHSLNVMLVNKNKKETSSNFTISNLEILDSKVVSLENSKVEVTSQLNPTKSNLILSNHKNVKSQTHNPSNQIKTSCPFGMELNDKSLDIYMSHDFVDRKLSSTSENDQWVNQRNQSEKSMYSYSLGVRFGYNLSYRWNLHTGLNFSQANQKFTYIDPESNQERYITIKDYVYDNGKIVDSIITTQVVIIPGTSKIQQNNTYRTFDIPVIARFTILANKHLSISTTIGTYINISQSSRGITLNENLQPRYIQEQRINKTQLGMSAYGGLSLAYHIAGDLDFVLEPHARIYFDDISKDLAPISQHHNIYGLYTGLRYKF